jgi:hypothetical protein
MTHESAEIPSASATEATISKPGAVLEVRAVAIPPRIQAVMATAIRDALARR